MNAKPQVTPIDRPKLTLPNGADKLLLHSCCAPCSGEVMEALLASGIDYTIYFYNPNIHPLKEYEIRKEENIRFAEKHGVPFIDADYDVDNWFERAKGMEYEPERGIRCTMCFDMRFERTALYAHEHGFKVISSSLGISRWKNMAQINDCGHRAAAHYPNIVYWDYNWRKGGGSQRMIEISKRERFYQQEFIPQAESRRDTHIRADAYHAVLLNWSNAVMLAAVGIIFYLSERLGWADTSAAAAVSMTLLFMRGPFMSAVGAFPALLQSKVGLQALAELGLTEYRQDFDTAFRLPENWREIRLENVAYAYPAQGGDSFILQPSSLTLKRGETVFLVGGNGSGKSTLFMLLTGLYVPASGRICLLYTSPSPRD